MFACFCHFGITLAVRQAPFDKCVVAHDEVAGADANHSHLGSAADPLEEVTSATFGQPLSYLAALLPSPLATIDVAIQLPRMATV